MYPIFCLFTNLSSQILKNLAIPNSETGIQLCSFLLNFSVEIPLTIKFKKKYKNPFDLKSRLKKYCVGKRKFCTDLQTDSVTQG